MEARIETIPASCPVTFAVERGKQTFNTPRRKGCSPLPGPGRLCLRLRGSFGHDTDSELDRATPSPGIETGMLIASRRARNSSKGASFHGWVVGVVREVRAFDYRAGSLVGFNIEELQGEVGE